MQSERQAAAPADRHRVRAAVRSDIPFLVEIDLIASSEPFGRPLWADLVEPTGTPVRDFLEAVLQTDASNWGVVEDFVIVECDGEPAAACAVFDAQADRDRQHPLRLDRLGQLAVRLAWPDAVVAAFRSTYEAEFQSANPDFFTPQAPAIIESVGVLPAFRGRGLGRRLMDAAFAAARGRGHAALGVMVIHGNEPARRLYERHFEPYATYHAAYFDGRLPGVTKFKAPLSAA